MSANDHDTSTKNFNPFEPPRARVDDPRPPGDEPLLAEPRRCPTGRGWGWIKDGWSLFKRAPGMWIGITVVWIVVVMGLAIIPVVNVVTGLLNLVFTGGLMVACHAAATGEGPRVGHIFAGFQRNFGSLILVSVLYLVGFLVVALIAAAVVFGIMGAGGDMSSIASGDVNNINPLTFIILALVIVALMIPLAMAIWFAPALVILKDQTALNAMSLSFKGCLRNMLPFLLYGIVFMVLGILAMLPLGLGWLILTPVLFGSMYAGYREIFLRTASGR